MFRHPVASKTEVQISQRGTEDSRQIPNLDQGARSPAMGPQPEPLAPSELGTKEYWDALYARELSNHASDPADTGTSWFEDSDAERKTTRFLGALAGAPPKATASVLDLGCGNGSMLLALRREGWTGRALGVDYSAKSVALARQVASSSAAAAAASAAVEFAEWDILGGAYAGVLAGEQAGGWDVVLDKGTFDAVSLAGRRLCGLYPGRVAPLVREGGILLVTSCNWTEDELADWFAGAGCFAVAGRVGYRSFSFGGVKGQTISTLCFRKL
ncbi:uncharacterized protein MAM_01604 [Metarhizium album ARSEF 1941]|uniref:Protein-lysine N-methyltransferase EFM4 n=1 Tax=Metarhizium album (strain ARSEF 1941) TaxID=1081103 RepID=A0A0B2X6B5_METAS|nr:uncharacterized protein MAM_01604 [Metarhizium album ARSEF 1941]KHO00826.1 hypothetical protein MAM_01604 [Metarhizium album ARSEF 1941]